MSKSDKSPSVDLVLLEGIRQPNGSPFFLLYNYYITRFNTNMMYLKITSGSPIMDSKVVQ